MKKFWEKTVKIGRERGGTIAGGALLGIANGLLGGGGGMIAVPLLEKRLPARCAHATAIAAVLPASLLSACVYVLFGFVPMSLFVPTALGVGLGGYLGAKLLAGSSPRAVSLAFSLVMLAAGLRMFFG